MKNMQSNDNILYKYSLYIKLCKTFCEVWHRAFSLHVKSR